MKSQKLADFDSAATATIDSPADNTATLEPLLPARIPAKGEFLFYYTQATPDDPIKSDRAEVLRVNQRGDGTITLLLRTPVEVIDEYGCCHHQKNMTRVREWVLMGDDDRPYQHNPSKHDLPPVGATVAVVLPGKQGVEFVRGRVLGPAVNRMVTACYRGLRIATPSLEDVQNVPWCGGEPKPGTWGHDPIVETLPE